MNPEPEAFRSFPFVPAFTARYPIGQTYRVASVPRKVAGASPPGGSSTDVDETKRNLLKLAVVAGVVGAAGGGLVGASLQYVGQPPIVGLSSYPKVALVDLDGSPLTATKVMSEYSVETPDVITFNYPLRNEPNFLLNLAPPAGGSGGATNVKGGVGPKNSIVAFSAICQHLGCPAPALSYYPPKTCSRSFGNLDFYIHCSCHGSTYDVSNGASNLTGPAVLPLPQVTLEWNASDDTISAIGETGPPVNGHLNTLQGDYGVSSTSQLEKQSPIILCEFGT
ncbi:MAG TPA: Rieske 2Fe-2S domain-containing protein [Thermoplasmata archaeon]|nr:Rieske 2Fe-2S domain-containing protein [Thermoplasmata archaeon]